MAELRGNLFVPQGSRSRVEVQSEGVYYEVPGVESVSYDAGTRESTTISALEGDATSLGSPSIEPVSLTLSAYAATHPVFAQMQTAFDNLSTLNFRITTPATQAISLAGAGTQQAQLVARTGGDPRLAGVTVSGVNQDAWTNGTVVRGMVLVRSRTIPTAPDFTNAFAIVSIDVTAAGALTDFSASSATGGIRVMNLVPKSPNTIAAAAAADYQVIGPGLIWEFAGRMESAPGFSFGSQASSPVATTLTVRPTVTIRQPTANLVVA